MRGLHLPLLLACGVIVASGFRLTPATTSPAACAAMRRPALAASISPEVVRTFAPVLMADDGKKAAVGKLKTLHDRRIGYLEAMLAKMGSPQFVTGDDYSYADIFLFTIVRAAQKCKGMQVLRDACGGDPFAACPTILAICYQN